ncbi:hypothetical protein E2562_017121 [Oryza meyeriana var. granulata]|uniref:Uncharacterized protein n=1 Tax=Oryza meyeriana var. granulata TaxID=110450 RepID=A0A6G1DXI3_9ORYZ|nr:hypothetical protein E2562_017121 [Oryza meyeriana var. granulata]
MHAMAVGAVVPPPAAKAGSMVTVVSLEALDGKVVCMLLVADVRDVAAHSLELFDDVHELGQQVIWPGDPRHIVVACRIEVSGHQDVMAKHRP